MRGGKFHNKMVEDAQTLFNKYSWSTDTEYHYQKNDITTYLDLYAVKEDLCIACEIETTARHAADNTLKALSAGFDLWIIVPSRRLAQQVESKLKSSVPAGTLHKVQIVLFCQLETELKRFQQTNLLKETLL